MTDEEFQFWAKLVSDEHDRQKAKIEGLRAAIAEACAIVASRVDALPDHVGPEMIDACYHPILDLKEKANA